MAEMSEELKLLTNWMDFSNPTILSHNDESSRNIMEMLTVCLVELPTRMAVLIPPGILDCHHE